MPPRLACSALAIAICLGDLPTRAHALGSETGIDEQAGLPYWQISDGNMSLRLVQRLPDQSRGFFLARGFSADHSERIAQSCVFQTVFKNSSDQTVPSVLRYDLREWIVRHGDQPGSMKTREHWQREWERVQAPQSARIAFEWALLPTRQTYRPGDYNWGMSIFGLKPGTRFDLEVVWQQHDQRRSAVIPDMECAPDIHPEPTRAP